MTLDKLAKGEIVHISGFQCSANGEEPEARIVAKLREIGFAEGDEVELLHKGAVFGTPLSFRLNRTIIALRRREAALINIQAIEQAAAQ